MEVFFSCRMGATDTPGARSRAVGWMFGRCSSSCCPIAASPPTPPRGFFRLGTCPAQPLHPGFAQCLKMLLQRPPITNLHPVPAAASVEQRWLFPMKPIAQPVPGMGICSARGWCCKKPETSPSFSNSFIVLLKRPFSSASTCHGCQVLFLSADLGSLLHLWPGSGPKSNQST